jgi:hypothetical protein
MERAKMDRKKIESGVELFNWFIQPFLSAGRTVKPLKNPQEKYMVELFEVKLWYDGYVKEWRKGNGFVRQWGEKEYEYDPEPVVLPKPLPI